MKFFAANKLLAKHIFDTLAIHNIWSRISLKTMFVKYKRSKLGFLWPFINSFFFAIIISVVFSEILDKNFSDYAPYLISGFIIWNFFTSIISEQTTIFTSNNIYLKELHYNLFFYIFKKNYELICIFIVNVLIFIILSALFFYDLSLNSFLLLINIPLIIVLSVFVAFVFGVINCFFRDFIFVVNNFMRLFFFVTPILWTVENAQGARGFISQYNPFFYLVDMLRSPLISLEINENSYIVYAMLVLLFYFLTIILYQTVYKKIIFYV